jgi:hypothetical protein
MFKSLTDFSYQRSPLQAVGFYIIYLVLTILAGAIAGMLFGLSTTNLEVDNGQKVGMITAILVVLCLSFLILQAKKLLNNYFYVGLAALSAVVAFLGGGLLGLIITAYLTTLSGPKKKSKK